jgi:hypothetical protein
MTEQEIHAALQANIGKKVKVAFDNQAETVVVISADPDGFLCRACSSDTRKPAAAEFWLTYKAVSKVDSAD